ncbi:MAG: cadmium-translocating P-type ATPase [Ruminococcus sp.]|nr:cadmium-translocating P-type ATPase [Ruminococcus sp.]
MQYTLILDDLNCAHCASKIESKIAQTEGYRSVSFNFATKKLRFETDKPNPKDEIQAICDSIEDGVHVLDEHAHDHHREHHEHHGCHDDHCNCREHEHKHEHEHAHGHGHGESGILKKVLLAASVVLGVAALVLHLTAAGEAAHWTVFGLSLAATLCAGYDVFLKGFKNAFKLRIEETVLITIAVIAAFCIGETVEAAMVTILFSIGEFIEDLAVGKSRRDIEKLSRIRPDTATLLENGQEREVPAADVAIGSLIVIKPHERVPLDGVVTDGSAELDVSALTGESLPQHVTKGSAVLSGSMNGDALLTVQTTAAFGDSTATRILRLVEDAAAQKGQREKLITRFANVYTPVVVLLSVLIAAVPPLCGLGSFTEWLMRALVVLVASCPCAIVISVPLAYYAGIGAGSRMGVLIKGGRYLEALAKADAFAFDKTGTLTTGKITVSDVYACDGYTEEEILSLAAGCEKYSSHPIAQAIRAQSNNAAVLTEHKEIAGVGTSAVYNGKTLCCGGSKLLHGSLPPALQGKNIVLLTCDGALIGAIEIGDTLRTEAHGVLRQLRELGIKRLLMLTGDAAANAAAVQRQLDGIETHAALLPQDKLQIIGDCQQDGSTVCFAGDGINDAPVLSKSDCGIAMGFGSEAAIEAADVVLSSGDLSALPKAVLLSRKTIHTIRTNIIFALAVKAAVIVLAMCGMAQMWMSVLADTGVCVACVLYTARLLHTK